MSEPKQPYRWPRRASASGTVHIVVGPSSFNGRERTACDMNLRTAGYDRTVDAVDCGFCLKMLSDARAGRHGDVTPLWGVDRAIMRTIAERESLHGPDETLGADVQNANV